MEIPTKTQDLTWVTNVAALSEGPDYSKRVVSIVLGGGTAVLQCRPTGSAHQWSTMYTWVAAGVEAIPVEAAGLDYQITRTGAADGWVVYYDDRTYQAGSPG